jgi:hypothetical protein
MPWALPAAGGCAGPAVGCPVVAGRCGAGQRGRWRRGVGSGGSSGARSRDHSRADRRSRLLPSPAGRAGSSPGGSRRGGGRAAGAAGRRGRWQGRRVWRTRWGDAYFRRPRRVVWCVEAPTTGEATASATGSIAAQVSCAIEVWPCVSQIGLCWSRRSPGSRRATLPAHPAYHSTGPPGQRLGSGRLRCQRALRRGTQDSELARPGSPRTSRSWKNRSSAKTSPSFKTASTAAAVGAYPASVAHRTASGAAR